MGMSLYARRFFSPARVVCAPACRQHGTSPSPTAQIDHAATLVDMLGARFPAFVLSKHQCLPCLRAKKLLRDMGVRYQDVKLDGLTKDEKMARDAHVRASTGAGTVPRVYIRGVCLGGFRDLQRKHYAGELLPALLDAGVTTEGVGTHY